MTKPVRVTVVCGGIASERDVSLRSGKAVAKALTARGYTVSEFDPREASIQDLILQKPDAVFLALHGAGGEDGSIQGMLEVLRIPYTGCGVMASAICYDKIQTKLALKPYKITTPAFVLFDSGMDIAKFVKTTKIVPPVIVKPSREGSTIGITIVRKKSELEAALREALRYCDSILIEKFIRGREITVGLLDGEALPIVEIAPKSGFYDYKSKYTPGQTEYLLPAPIKESLAKKIQKQSELIYKRLGCSGAARADYILDKNGVAHFLEINTIPGMTETSLLPKAANARGLDFADLCERILASAKLGIYQNAAAPELSEPKHAAPSSGKLTAAGPLAGTDERCILS